jgi:hypothetical protein
MPERVDRKALKRANHGALWRFPCREFILVRRKDSREVLDLHCSGTPFAPESVRQWRFDLPGLEELPESGDVLPVGMYDDLLQRLPVGRAH